MRKGGRFGTFWRGGVVLVGLPFSLLIMSVAGRFE